MFYGAKLDEIDNLYKTNILKCIVKVQNHKSTVIMYLQEKYSLIFIMNESISCDDTILITERL